MITLSVSITKNWIELDFHGNQRSFADFDSLWAFCLLTATNRGIFKVKIIHGRGKDKNGLAFIDDSIRGRLDRLRGVRWYQSDGGKLGVTLVYLSNNIRKHRQHKTNHQKLLELSKELQNEEVLDKNKIDSTKENDVILKTTLRSLDTSWDEALILNTAQILLDSGDIDLLLSLLSEIKIFEVFYTDSFRLKLDHLVMNLDRL